MANNENKLLTKDFDEFKIQYLKQISDPNITKKELLQLKSKAAELYSQYQNLELTVKKDANSLYGTSANEFFIFRDYNVSTDITMACKHATVIVDKGINYFFNDWANMSDVVAKIKTFYPNVNIVNNQYKVEGDKYDLCVYGDTDSRYVDLGAIYKLMNIEIPESDYELADFGEFLVNEFINKLIAETIRKDCEYRNAHTGYLNMTHEITTRTSALLGKKQNLMTVIWKDGKKIERKLKFTGIELKKGGTSPRIKKMIEIIIKKFFVDNKPFSEIQQEVIQCFKYIISRQERSFIYKISTVNELNLITENPDTGVFESEKKHIQHKVALFWFNFIKNRPEYKPPFEGQKMNWYYDINGNAAGVPDDVDIDTVKNMPKPDYVRMLKLIFIKSILKYITEYQNKDITETILVNFLANIKPINFED